MASGVFFPKKTEPAFLTRGSSSNGSSTQSSRCSGAMALAVSMACSMEEATMIFPRLSTLARAMTCRSSCASCTSTCSCTACASWRLSVTKTALAMVSCSAWDNKSAATYRGLAVLSASTRISLGPAIMSIST